ncbi:S-layer homology domain-containing protein [Priestia endophytica]|uniref:S-layer homology domain-containing protein n=1 Tax=Priestia endophytica TaxID=135735 RepID=UPI002E1B219B|nr:S-layer homology domain-containing protein [Priestia endophytica]
MKKFGRMLLALSLLMTVIIPFQHADASRKFKDVTLYEKEINFLADKGIINGYDNGTFQPEASIKRIQAVQMLLRAKGIKDLSGAPDPNFADLKKGDYGYEEAAKAVQLGFISGKQDSKTGKKYFNPWDTLTRGQMAKVLSLAYNLKGTTISEFYDVPSTDGFYTYINALAYNNVTTGYSNNTFKPYQSISRQHFSVFLARTLDSSFKEDAANRAITGGLKPNPRKTYVYSYPFDENYSETVKYTGTVSGIDNWTGRDTDGETYDYAYSEDKDGFIAGWQDGFISSTVPYPLQLNTKWTDDFYEDEDPIAYVVTSMNKTITTQAGTFKNAIEIKSSLDTSEYYVQGVGLVLMLDTSVKPADKIQELKKIY